MLAAAHPPIAEVTPPEEREVTVMTVFPTLGAFRRPLDWSFVRHQAGFGFFTLGKLFALLLIPVAIGLFASMLLPFTIRRYSSTNRRLMVQKGLQSVA